MMSKLIAQFNPLPVRQSSFLQMIWISFLASAEVLERHFSDESGSSDDQAADECPSKTKNMSRSNHSVPLSDPKGKKWTKKKDSSSVTRLKPTSNDPKSLIDCEEVRVDLSQQSSLLKQLLHHVSEHRQQLNEFQLYHSSRKKTQLEILKNQKTLAKALNNRDVRSPWMRN
jgi:hypothetical protein